MTTAAAKKPRTKAKQFRCVFRRCDNGTLDYRRLPLKKAKSLKHGDKLKFDGVEMIFEGCKDLRDHSHVTAMSVRGVVWPIRNIRGGCHPSQAKALNERMKAKGMTGVRYDERNGDVTFTGKDQYRKWMKETGHFNSKGYE